MSLASSDSIKLKKAAYDNPKKSKKIKSILNLKDNYSEVISTIVVCNNLFNILASTLATIFFIGAFGGNDALGSMVSFVVMTLLVIIVCELIPKFLGIRMPEKSLMIVVGYLKAIIFIFKPFTYPISKMIKIESSKLMTSTQELRLALDESGSNKIISNFENIILSKTLDLNNLTAKDKMTKKVYSFSKDISIEELKTKIIKFNRSRLVVHGKNSKEIIGIFNVTKFLLDSLRKDEKKMEISDYISKPLLVNETNSLYEIFQLLQNNRRAIAIVRNDKEEMTGILTFEDIFEYVFGEIFDEKDRIEKNVVKKIDNSYLIKPKSTLEELIIKHGLPLKNILPEKSTTIEDWMKKQFDISSLEPGLNYTYENIIFWIKKEEFSNNVLIELDIV